jgi:hypothetical protein
MKRRITRISILQSSKVATALYFIIGFIYTVIGIPMIIFGSKQLQVMGTIYLFMPIVLAIFGFIFFAIAAALYNLLAKWLGGFEIEVANVD